jgi:chromosome partitioning protein
MAIVVFVNQKGGCGKSSSAVHYAYWLTQQGKRVLLVDADAQRSSSRWLESMDDKIPHKVLQTPDDILDQIPELAEQHDYLIVDGPGGLAEPTRAILFRADLAVVPCKPTGLDLQSAFDAVKLVRQAQSVRKGSPKAAMFLSMAVKGTKLKDEATAVLSKTQEVAPLLKSVIHQKQAIADAPGQSATVWDLSGRPAAESRREYERLFKEIMGMLP